MNPVTEVMTKFAAVLEADGTARDSRPTLALVAVVLADASTVDDADWLKVPAKFRGTILAVFAAAMSS